MLKGPRPGLKICAGPGLRPGPCDNMWVRAWGPLVQPGTIIDQLGEYFHIAYAYEILQKINQNCATAKLNPICLKW